MNDRFRRGKRVIVRRAVGKAAGNGHLLPEVLGGSALKSVVRVGETTALGLAVT
ncbi:Uncharacterised protein [Mobiluncus curtisii subsp. curtisii]|nr:Uncharacterised protein [Mobiluncus curtisii subsp. curtisii]STY80873.1 Uncharacterised protein [Mobiluncus curtisii subsp. curtisii]